MKQFVDIPLGNVNFYLQRKRLFYDNNVNKQQQEQQQVHAFD